MVGLEKWLLLCCLCGYPMLIRAQVSCEIPLTAELYEKSIAASIQPRSGYACMWYIKAEEGWQVKLLIAEAYFDSCKDYLKIYGESTPNENNLIGNICGPTDDAFISYYNEMTLEFHRDVNAKNNSKIKLLYSAFQPDPFVETHKTLRAAFYKNAFRSKYYPHHNYPERIIQTWLLQTDPDYLCINVVYMDIELTPGCNHDFLQIFDGPNDKGTDLGKRCGKKVFSQCSSGLNMFIKFYSDNRRTGEGFMIEFRTYKYDDNGNPEGTHFQNSTVWLSVGISSAVCLMAVAACIAIYRRRTSVSGVTSPCTRFHNTQTVWNNSPSVAVIPTPPSYEEAMKNTLPNDSPPPYETVDLEHPVSQP